MTKEKELQDKRDLVEATKARIHGSLFASSGKDLTIKKYTSPTGLPSYDIVTNEGNNYAISINNDGTLHGDYALKEVLKTKSSSSNKIEKNELKNDNKQSPLEEAYAIIDATNISDKEKLNLKNKLANDIKSETSAEAMKLRADKVVIDAKNIKENNEPENNNRPSPDNNNKKDLRPIKFNPLSPKDLANLTMAKKAR